MSRAIVLGGAGLFGRTAAALLREMGIALLTASRRAGDRRVDADDRESILRAFRTGDVVIDTAGPFGRRSTALVEAAIEAGFDVVDINDDLGYAEAVSRLGERIDAAGVRVLSSASSVSAISSRLVAMSGVERPARVTGFLAPASRHTANRGSALSLLASVGGTVRARRGGALVELRGWSERRRFPMPAPIGPIRGRLFESADALHLPRAWPSIAEVDMFVDANAPGLNALLDVAARVPAARRLMERCVALGTAVVRLTGSRSGGLGYEIEDADGHTARLAVVSARNGFVTPVAPAVLAARRILEGRFEARGLVEPLRHADDEELLDYLASHGIEVVRL